jgi:hypothetical protein
VGHDSGSYTNTTSRFESVTKGDRIFRDGALGRIIEPTTKADATEVLGEVGVGAAPMAF